MSENNLQQSSYIPSQVFLLWDAVDKTQAPDDPDCTPSLYLGHTHNAFICWGKASVQDSTQHVHIASWPSFRKIHCEIQPSFNPSLYLYLGACVQSAMPPYPRLLHTFWLRRQVHSTKVLCLLPLSDPTEQKTFRSAKLWDTSSASQSAQLTLSGHKWPLAQVIILFDMSKNLSCSLCAGLANCQPGCDLGLQLPAGVEPALCHHHRHLQHPGEWGRHQR